MRNLPIDVAAMASPDEDMVFPIALRTVKIKRGDEEYEILPDQLNTETLRRIFAVSPDGVWLHEEYSGRVYFPDTDGQFRLHDASIG